MKAIIEFDLNDQDDLHSYNLCNNAANLHTCLWQFDQKLRSMYKYEGVEGASIYRDLLHEYLKEYNIKL
jgi:hypothetical protein